MIEIRFTSYITFKYIASFFKVFWFFSLQR